MKKPFDELEMLAAGVRAFWRKISKSLSARPNDVAWIARGQDPLPGRVGSGRSGKMERASGTLVHARVFVLLAKCVLPLIKKYMRSIKKKVRYRLMKKKKLAFLR